MAWQILYIAAKSEWEGQGAYMVCPSDLLKQSCVCKNAAELTENRERLQALLRTRQFGPTFFASDITARPYIGRQI